MATKKVLEWLDQLPGPVKDKALANTGRADAREWAPDLATALKHAFIWYQSPEGFAYWHDIYQQVKEHEKSSV